MSKNMVEQKGPQMTSQYGAFSLHAGLARLYARARMHTDTLTHADRYVILIAFPQQQWLQEHALMLRYTHIACFVMHS